VLNCSEISANLYSQQTAFQSLGIIRLEIDDNGVFGASEANALIHPTQGQVTNTSHISQLTFNIRSLRSGANLAFADLRFDAVIQTRVPGSTSDPDLAQRSSDDRST
jgi:hypothetical protein